MSWLSSVLGNIGFGSSSTNSNTNQSFNTNTNTSQSGQSSTQRTLTPYQQQLQSPLFSLVTSAMTNPGQFLQPFYQGARDSTNQNYAGLADTLRQQFMGSGNGSSGKFGSALVQGNLQRLGALQNVDTGFQQEQAQLPFTAAQLGEQLLGMNMGQTSTASQTGTQTSTGTSSSSTKSSTSGFHI